MTRIVHEHLFDKDMLGLKANIDDFTLKLCQIELDDCHASLIIGDISGVILDSLLVKFIL